MKQKLSISIEEKLISLLEGLVETGKFRNKSHVVEWSLRKLLENEDG